ncbi:hypothetical protein SDC9_201312 [bioreactor metagenome]|uniref:Uncharacterized protein n=1 Tax=bioreactor metagenome TaxID=1076179 RepID=A0A645IQJ7_9ZZZZ
MVQCGIERSDQILEVECHHIVLDEGIRWKHGNHFDPRDYLLIIHREMNNTLFRGNHFQI